MSKPNKAGGSAPMPYFYITRDYDNNTADVYIFGDIASERGGLSKLLASSSDVSAHSIVEELSYIEKDCDVTVHINSNGGEIKEGLGIYNVLKERGNVTTICDGFAASAGSIIFAAGSRRIMNPASLLFIHQALISTSGNADELAKTANDLRTITDAAVNAYVESGVNISREELMGLLKAETWIGPEDAVKMGFATEIAAEDTEEDVVHNDAMRSIIAAVSAPKSEPVEPVLTSSEMIEALKAEFGHVADLVAKVETVLAENPAVVSKVEAFLDKMNLGTPTPNSGNGDHRGFFNF